MTRVVRMRHQALQPLPEAAGSTELDEIVATDLERAAFLLQGAALLAHLGQVGWRLASWRGLRVDVTGVLRVPLDSVRRTPEDRLPQARLRELAAVLFGSESAPGRGAVRAALRPLVESWRDELLAMSANRMVADILARAPFLWESRFDSARASLFAVVEDRNGERVVVVGQPGWRRFLARTDAADRLEIAAGGEAAHSWWQRVRTADPAARSSAAAAWAASARAKQPFDRPEDRQAFAHSLLDDGRFEAVLDLVKGSRRTDDLLLRLRAQLRMGRTVAARRTLGTLEKRPLSGRRALDRCELAVGVHAAAGRPDPLRAWSERVLEAAVGADAARGRVVCALAMWELGDVDAMARHLEAAPAEPEHSMDVLARARLASVSGGVGEAERLLASGLRRLGARLPVHERALLWNELAAVRMSANDLGGAERAARLAAGLFRRCDGPAGRVAAHGNLAEVRIRTGRFAGVRETIESLRRESMMAGSAPGLVEAGLLEARLQASMGRWQSALECCDTAREHVRGRRSVWPRRRSLLLLSARAQVHLGRADAAGEELSQALEWPRAWWTPADADDLAPLLLLAGLREEATTIAAGGALEGLWKAVGAGLPPTPADWKRVELQGPYRAALTVHDLACLGLEAVPVGLVAAAVRTFSAAGAEALVQRLDGAHTGPWRALRLFLATPAPDADAYRLLMSAAGHPEARLAVHGSAGGGALPAASEAADVLLPGPGGADQFAVDAAAGRVVLSTKKVDEPARALAAAVATRLPAAPRRRGRASVLAEPGRASVSGMVGESRALRDVQARIEKLAAHDLPVLILGESGTGKELLARQLHRSSARASLPWLAVNCAALPDGLILSDLFGHSRGAFTGAHADRIGVFESVNGGTVFLDEIGELPWAAQGMLLRLLQEGEMRRVGESRLRRLDFRLVSATHKDLAAMVRADEFRQDLYYRLRVACAEAPPLREREGDVMLLAQHFLEAAGPSGQDLDFDEEARTRIRNHSWPGNVRELKNAIDGAVALAEGPEISADMLGLPDEAVKPPPKQSGYHWKMDQYRRRLIEEALAESGGNQARAARALGMSRQALSYLVRKLNYEPLTGA